MKDLSPGFFAALSIYGALVMVGLLLLALSGCASGIVMTDAEKINCRDQGCAAFTEQEFVGMMGRAFKEGYQHGWRDFARQTGRAL